MAGRFFTSGSVTHGHPGKIAGRVSAAAVDALPDPARERADRRAALATASGA
jgi:S-adenosylmethionine synthetase